MKLIDHYLPTWDFAKSNRIQLDTGRIPDQLNIKGVDFRKSRIIRALFFLRGLPAQTRIRSTSRSARRKFSVYWAVIGFFSGVIRREMLTIIKNEQGSN